MIERIRVSIVLATVAIGLAAPTLRAQTINSPYRFVETSQSLGVYAGYAKTGIGALSLGPESAPIFGARYGLRVSGPFSAEADISLLSSTRMVWDTVPSDTALRNVGEADLRMLTALAALRFDVTGPRAWHGLQPYVTLGGGLGFDLAPDAPAEEALAEDVRFDLGTRFVALAGGGIEAHFFGRITVRADARTLLWKLNTPDPFLLGEPALYRPADEWTQNLLITGHLAFRF
jgi:hypothetical protein